jgi:hypothetical protein
MRRVATAYLVALVSSVFASDNALAEQTFAWNDWRNVPVLDGGRVKPLDSLAWETFGKV